MAEEAYKRIGTGRGLKLLNDKWRERLREYRDAVLGIISTFLGIGSALGVSYFLVWLILKIAG
ncbi:MAG: hypothetical protein JXA49_10080 [Actinobacteria bacterium]|nr:hypothetical protein [Actinomycetota bacterium]